MKLVDQQRQALLFWPGTLEGMSNESNPAIGGGLERGLRAVPPWDQLFLPAPGHLDSRPVHGLSLIHI